MPSLGGEPLEVTLTSANTSQVEEPVKHVVGGEPNLDPIISQQIKKIGRVACKALANAYI